jgi:hypothetical protein
MKHQPHFESARQTAKTEAERVRGMIADLSRTVHLLDCDVAAEEERCRIYDLSDAEYPMLARNIAARSENLKATIAALEARLTSTISVAATEVRKGSSERRGPRRKNSPRRFEAWLR